MLQWKHSAILSTFIKLPFSIKTFVLSISKWLLKTGFAVCLLVCLSKSLEIVDRIEIGLNLEGLDFGTLLCIGMFLLS